MKKKNIVYLKNVFLGILTLVIVGCDNDDDGNNPQFDGMDVTALQSTVTTGTWRITRFIEDGSDETANFEGYSFSFEANGSFSADDGTNTFTGLWLVEMDDDDDDDGGDDDFNELEFDIDISTSDDVFDDLDDDWYVLEYSENRISLAEDDDDLDDDDDFLTFERN